jgi:sugar phosphate isomerase/epimerase
MIGVLNTSLPGYERQSPSEAIKATRDYGLDALLFDNMLDLFPGLASETLDRLAGEAKAAGIELATSIGFFNPANPHRCQSLVAAGGGDIAQGVLAAVAAARRLGSKTLFFMIGKIEDRDKGSVSWQRQLDGVVETLLPLRPQLRASGVQLLLKTHEEMSTQEGLRIIEAVGGDVLGISLDPVNLLCRIEDPVAAARRVAKYIRQVHLDDAFVIFEGDQLRRYLAPMGEGEVDWGSLLDIAPDAIVWVEFHRGQFAMPVFDARWVAAQPDLILDEYRAAVAAGFKNREVARQHVDQLDPCGRFGPALSWLGARGQNSRQ